MKSKTPRTDRAAAKSWYASVEVSTHLERELNHLLAVAAKTIQDNLHLADGDVCTLKELRDVVNNLNDGRDA